MDDVAGGNVSGWHRLLSWLAIAVGVLFCFLATGVGVSGTSGITTGGIVLVVALLLGGIALLVWGTSRLRS